ncbi:MAG: DUF2121 domain-containing protein [Methanotrichaceae archaeon]|nr:DUF2121 domain-containing protein [Methanotrichaceae archaeon]
MIGGDKRSIIFGDSSADAALEEELYSGKIGDDRSLLRRAEDLGACCQISDEREKVWQKGDVLVGEVAEISLTTQRRRRIYLTRGAYLLVEVNGQEAVVKGKGRSGWVVLGNRFAQKLAHDSIRDAGARPDQTVIEKVLMLAGTRTASVSRDFTVLNLNSNPSDHGQSDPEARVEKAFAEDCRELGWSLCAPQ